MTGGPGIELGVPGSSSSLPSISANAFYDIKDNGIVEDAPNRRRASAANGNASKRRRNTSITPSVDEASSTITPGSLGDGNEIEKPAKEKKKKANRACNHCQKAHLTCDDSRPCQRCVKRGIADTCAEGQRKKAKYLLDDDELEALKKTKDQGKTTDTNGSSNTRNQSTISTPITSMPPPAPVQNDTMMQDVTTDPLFNLSFDPSYQFGSQAANLEYSILSAILGNPSPEDTGTNDGSTMQASPPSPPLSAMSSFPSNAAIPSGWPGLPSTSTIMADDASMSMSVDSILSPFAQRKYLEPVTPLTPPASDPSPASPRLGQSTAAQMSPTQQTQSLSKDSLKRFPRFGTAASKQALAIQHQRSTTVYKETNKPFDYVDGYHYLMKYLQGRFEKNDILRIVRALAFVRPSLIALQMPLSIEDEIFVEKSFQRTMIELEKLISYSGTPTVVWRRTGEICLVGLEFTMLTEWTRQELLSSRKFIYELFEHQSVVEYWENYAAHAFESSSQSVYSHCVLLKPNGSPVPCSFCFSVRRDVFDLPNVIIGQWLPLL